MTPYSPAIAYLAPLLSRLAPIRTALSDLATEARRVLDREGRIAELEASCDFLASASAFEDVLDAAQLIVVESAMTRADAAQKRSEAAEVQAVRLADQLRASQDSERANSFHYATKLAERANLAEVAEAKLADLGDELRSALADATRAREERDLAARGVEGRWLWSDTDPNDLESMGDAMLVTMTAGQLRRLLAEKLAASVPFAEVLPVLRELRAAAVRAENYRPLLGPTLPSGAPRLWQGLSDETRARVEAAERGEAE